MKQHSTMKKKMQLLVLLAGLGLCSKAQVALYESFNSPANLTSSGWSLQNLSSPMGTNTTGWFQGNPARFIALSGAGTDYYAADIGSTSSAGTTNTISAWLITPTLNLVNGAIVQFATRAAGSTPAKADRLQLYYSTAGAGTNVGTSVSTATNSAGTFTDLVFDMNAGMAAMGYINEWVVITKTLSGISAPTVGRLGFRYYIPNGGAAGTNGDYIGIDEFRYSAPCTQPNVMGSWVTNTLCTGAPLTLSVSNFGSSPATYTWISGSNAQSISVVPTSTGVNSYYVLSESTPGCIDLETINPYILPSPTVSATRSPGGTVCSGSSLTITATGATNYTYMLGSTNSTVNPITVVAPTVGASVTTQFTLVGRGSSNNCRHTQVLGLIVMPNPTVSVAFSSSVVCAKNTVTVTGSGASSYTWSGAATSTNTSFTFSSTAAGAKQFTVSGTSADGCKSTAVVASYTVSACTGINDLNGNAMNWSIGPNPFKDQLHFGNITETLRLYNSLGQMIAEIQPGEAQSLNTSSFAPGIYLLSTENNSRQMKLIKNQ